MTAGLSPTTITRLKAGWETQYQQWSRRSLEERLYVYVWADGVYFNVRLESEANRRQCILVLMGATAAGQKELIAVIDGYRESEQSWKELLLEIRRRGLVIDPALAIADVHLKTGGSVVVKILEGGEVPQIHQSMRGDYERVERLRPRATRKESSEFFFIGLHKRPPATGES